MNAAEKARLAKEKEEQARLQRIEEEKKLKAERRQQKKQAITEFRKKHGWQCLAVSSFILLGIGLICIFATERYSVGFWVAVVAGLFSIVPSKGGMNLVLSSKKDGEIAMGAITLIAPIVYMVVFFFKFYELYRIFWLFNIF